MGIAGLGFTVYGLYTKCEFNLQKPRHDWGVQIIHLKAL